MFLSSPRLGLDLLLDLVALGTGETLSERGGVTVAAVERRIQ